MNELKNITVTDIEPPIIVHSEKGRKFKMTNRISYGLSLCVDGQITYTMNDKNFVSTKNNVIILPKGSSYTLSGDKDGLFPLINFHTNDYLCDEITVIPLNNPDVCIKYFDNIKSCYYNHYQQFKTFGYLYMLLDEIFSNNIKKNSIINSATKYIEKNLSCYTLTNEDIANYLKISEVYLRKLFVKHLNQTPKQYIIEHRLKNAKTLLTDNSIKTTAIAEKCGFSSVYHFSRAFKQKTGLTPSQYAEKNKVFKI